MMGLNAAWPNRPCTPRMAPRSATTHTMGMYGSITAVRRTVSDWSGVEVGSDASATSPSSVIPASRIASNETMVPANRRAATGSSRSSRA